MASPATHNNNNINKNHNSIELSNGTKIRQGYSLQLNVETEDSIQGSGIEWELKKVISVLVPHEKPVVQRTEQTGQKSLIHTLIYLEEAPVICLSMKMKGCKGVARIEAVMGSVSRVLEQIGDQEMASTSAACCMWIKNLPMKYFNLDVATDDEEIPAVHPLREALCVVCGLNDDESRSALQLEIPRSDKKSNSLLSPPIAVRFPSHSALTKAVQFFGANSCVASREGATAIFPVLVELDTTSGFMEESQVSERAAMRRAYRLALQQRTKDVELLRTLLKEVDEQMAQAVQYAEKSEPVTHDLKMLKQGVEASRSSIAAATPTTRANQREVEKGQQSFLQEETLSANALSKELRRWEGNLKEQMAALRRNVQAAMAAREVEAKIAGEEAKRRELEEQLDRAEQVLARARALSSQGRRACMQHTTRKDEDDGFGQAAELVFGPLDGLCRVLEGVVGTGRDSLRGVQSGQGGMDGRNGESNVSSHRTGGGTTSSGCSSSSKISSKSKGNKSSSNDSSGSGSSSNGSSISSSSSSIAGGGRGLLSARFSQNLEKAVRAVEEELSTREVVPMAQLLSAHCELQGSLEKWELELSSNESVGDFVGCGEGGEAAGGGGGSGGSGGEISGGGGGGDGGSGDGGDGGGGGDASNRAGHIVSPEEPATTTAVKKVVVSTTSVDLRAAALKLLATGRERVKSFLAFVRMSWTEQAGGSGGTDGEGRGGRKVGLGSEEGSGIVAFTTSRKARASGGANGDAAGAGAEACAGVTVGAKANADAGAGLGESLKARPSVGEAVRSGQVEGEDGLLHIAQAVATLMGCARRLEEAEGLSASVRRDVAADLKELTDAVSKPADRADGSMRGKGDASMRGSEGGSEGAVRVSEAAGEAEGQARGDELRRRRLAGKKKGSHVGEDVVHDDDDGGGDDYDANKDDDGDDGGGDSGEEEERVHASRLRGQLASLCTSCVSETLDAFDYRCARISSLARSPAEELLRPAVRENVQSSVETCLRLLVEGTEGWVRGKEALREEAKEGRAQRARDRVEMKRRVREERARARERERERKREEERAEEQRMREMSLRLEELRARERALEEELAARQAQAVAAPPPSDGDGGGGGDDEDERRVVGKDREARDQDENEGWRKERVRARDWNRGRDRDDDRDSRERSRGDDGGSRERVRGGRRRYDSGPGGKRSVYDDGGDGDADSRDGNRNRSRERRRERNWSRDRDRDRDRDWGRERDRDWGRDRDRDKNRGSDRDMDRYRDRDGDRDRYRDRDRRGTYRRESDRSRSRESERDRAYERGGSGDGRGDGKGERGSDRAREDGVEEGNGEGGEESLERRGKDRNSRSSGNGDDDGGNNNSSSGSGGDSGSSHAGTGDRGQEGSDESRGTMPRPRIRSVVASVGGVAVAEGDRLRGSTTTSSSFSSSSSYGAGGAVLSLQSASARRRQAAAEAAAASSSGGRGGGGVDDGGGGGDGGGVGRVSKADGDEGRDGWDVGVRRKRKFVGDDERRGGGEGVGGMGVSGREDGGGRGDVQGDEDVVGDERARKVRAVLLLEDGGRESGATECEREPEMATEREREQEFAREKEREKERELRTRLLSQTRKGKGKSRGGERDKENAGETGTRSGEEEGEVEGEHQGRDGLTSAEAIVVVDEEREGTGRRGRGSGHVGVAEGDLDTGETGRAGASTAEATTAVAAAAAAVLRETELQLREKLLAKALRQKKAPSKPSA